MTHAAASAAASRIDWQAIDTVLLDMDGTLLDLSFDNWFWAELVPAEFARARGISASAAQALLEPRYRAAMGTLDWYCIDFWTRELALDIPAIKRGVREQVAWLPGAPEFLAALKTLGKRRILVTNAHPETLAIKDQQVGVRAHLDGAYSSHPFGYPKEHPEFWPKLRAELPFDPARTLFVDDSLPVLRAAQEFGIGWLRAVRRPDSRFGARDTAEFIGVDAAAELLLPP